MLQSRGTQTDAQMYKRLRKWLPKRGSVFERDFLVVPVHNFTHWSAIIVINPRHLTSSANIDFLHLRKTVGSIDVLRHRQETLKDFVNEKAPCVIHLDSLKVHRSRDVAKWLRHALEVVAYAEGQVPHEVLSTAGQTTPSEQTRQQIPNKGAAVDNQLISPPVRGEGDTASSNAKVGLHQNSDHSASSKNETTIASTKRRVSQTTCSNANAKKVKLSQTKTNQGANPDKTKIQKQALPTSAKRKFDAQDDVAEQLALRSTKSSKRACVGEVDEVDERDSPKHKHKQGNKAANSPDGDTSDTPTVTDDTSPSSSQPQSPLTVTKTTDVMQLSVLCPGCHKSFLLHISSDVSGYPCPICHLHLNINTPKTEKQKAEEKLAEKAAEKFEKERKGRAFHVDHITLPAFKVQTPQQPNNVDCALYMMHNVEMFLRHFGSHADRFRYHVVMDRCRKIGISRRWYTVQSMKHKRSELRAELLALSNQRKNGKRGHSKGEQ